MHSHLSYTSAEVASVGFFFLLAGAIVITCGWFMIADVWNNSSYRRARQNRITNEEAAMRKWRTYMDRRVRRYYR